LYLYIKSDVHDHKNILCEWHDFVQEGIYKNRLEKMNDQKELPGFCRRGSMVLANSIDIIELGGLEDKHPIRRTTPL